jgi:mannosyltransferase
MILFFTFTRKIHIRLKFVDYFVVVSFIPVVAVYLLSFYKPIFLPRYLIFVTPSLFTLLAWMLMNFGKQVFSGLSIILITLMLMSLNFQDMTENTFVKEDYREVVAVVQSKVDPRDIIVVSAPFTTYPIEYYYSGPSRIETIPPWNRYVQGPISNFTVEGLKKQIDDYSKKYYRIYLILSYDQGYQEKIVDYMDHHYERLLDQKFPANINLRAYQLRYDPQVQLTQE